MTRPKGRPKTYGGTQIGVRLPGMVDLRLRAEAQQRGKTLSDLVRETLVEKWGGDSGGPSRNSH